MRYSAYNTKKIKELGKISRTLAFLELRALANILYKDEKIEKIAQGVNKKAFCIIVATDKRVIFMNKVLLWGLNVEDYLYKDIDSIEYYLGPIFGSLYIATIGHVQSRVNKIFKGQIMPFVNFVRSKIDDSKSGQSGSNDVIEKLEKLADLKERGILTEEEFDKQKKKVLD